MNSVQQTRTIEFSGSRENGKQQQKTIWYETFAQILELLI